ncbi:hypothetical protein QTH15_05400 [Clostridium perfringens]|nr:hypothetical protein [Clostridium perfringens]
MNKEQKVLNKVITNSIEKYFIRDSVSELTEKEKVLLERVNKDVLEV